nr:histidine phosphatase family protein [Candidimonas sp. SYP-B2681]
MRHAKSDHHTAPSDEERPLNDRGIREATKMGRRLAKKNPRPDLLVSSPAVRAMTTARIIAQEMGYQLTDIAVNDTLYDAETSDILMVVRNLDDQANVVMMFGHNPGLTDLVHDIWPPITHLPTCAVAEFSFEIDSWSKIGSVAPINVALISPKEE